MNTPSALGLTMFAVIALVQLNLYTAESIYTAKEQYYESPTTIKYNNEQTDAYYGPVSSSKPPTKPTTTPTTPKTTPARMTTTPTRMTTTPTRMTTTPTPSTTPAMPTTTPTRSTTTPTTPSTTSTRLTTTPTTPSTTPTTPSTTSTTPSTTPTTPSTTPTTPSTTPTTPSTTPTPLCPLNQTQIDITLEYLRNLTTVNATGSCTSGLICGLLNALSAALFGGSFISPSGETVSQAEIEAIVNNATAQLTACGVTNIPTISFPTTTSSFSV